MSSDDELIGRERAGWAALGTSADAATSFYEDVLADEVLFLLPGGMVIDDRAGALEALRGPPWASHELSDERVVWLSRDSAVVAYRAHAVRDGTPYDALVASTYVRRDGSWRLAVHQQTPT